MQPMPHDEHDPFTETAERRTESRQPAESRVSVQVDTRDFGGTSKNLSQAGVFFFSGDRLRVTVQVEDANGLRTCRGSLVRVERMDAETTGFAIEFDQ